MSDNRLPAPGLRERAMLLSTAVKITAMKLSIVEVTVGGSTSGDGFGYRFSASRLMSDLLAQVSLEHRDLEKNGQRA